MWLIRKKKFVLETVQAKNLHAGDWLVTNGIGEQLAFVGRNDSTTFTACERFNPRENSKHAIMRNFKNEEHVEIYCKK